MVKNPSYKISQADLCQMPGAKVKVDYQLEAAFLKAVHDLIGLPPAPRKRRAPQVKAIPKSKYRNFGVRERHKPVPFAPATHTLHLDDDQIQRALYQEVLC